MRARFISALKRLRHATDGIVAFELIIVIPAFVLAIVVTFTAFDMYRLESRDAKAAIAVADSLSRETFNITPAELDTLAQLHGGLIQTAGRRGLRIAVVDTDDSGAFRIRWSRSRTSSGFEIPELTAQVLTDTVPTLAPGEVVILTQTFIEFTPFTGKGFSLTQFEHRAVMRPRNAPQMCWSSRSRTSSQRIC